MAKLKQSLMSAAITAVMGYGIIFLVLDKEERKTLVKTVKETCTTVYKTTIKLNQLANDYLVVPQSDGRQNRERTSEQWRKIGY